MFSNFPLFPQAASVVANRVDHLYIFLLIIATFFSTLIFVSIFYFAIKFRRRRPGEGVKLGPPPEITGILWLEVLWMGLPLLIMLVVFVWSAAIYVHDSRPPANAIEIYVVGKQWMWKLQHPEGQREINELHVPAGQPVKLTMTSEDVIHSFYLPAFRIKQDVLPGRYTSEWFEATKPGDYHLFCAEYCGTQHSGMIGWVHVMQPADYERWLNGGGGGLPPPGETMASAGGRLFQKLGCITCHRIDETAKCPPLVGVYGKPRPLADGRIVLADEAYIRESILNPKAKIVAGYQPVMPTFQGQVSEEQLLQLIAYIKSLRRD